MALSGSARSAAKVASALLILLTHRGHPARVEAAEVEATGVGQMLGLDVAER